MTQPAGPTLNPEYNAALVKWDASGFHTEPFCEECGCDLRGKQVIDIGILWACEECAEADDSDAPDYREDFHSDS